MCDKATGPLEQDSKKRKPPSCELHQSVGFARPAEQAPLHPEMPSVSPGQTGVTPIDLYRKPVHSSMLLRSVLGYSTSPRSTISTLKHSMINTTK